jgi:hypothetical protein
VEPHVVGNGRGRRGRGRDLAAASRSAAETREARLTADSGDRAGRGGPRVLVFVDDGWVVALEATVGADGGRHRVTGAITPPPGARTPVRTRGRGRPVGALTDVAGRFALDDVASGPFSLTLAPDPDGPPLVTEWVVL